MIIKEVNIKSFARLKNTNIKLNEGLNLIYGENERGKSSIQTFIKLWFCGIPKGDRTIREKYLPFSGERMEGTILFAYGDKEYIIERYFGKTKKEDYLRVFNKVTGEEVNLNGREVLEAFFNVTEKMFSKTAFISQQGVKIIKEKKDDLLKERLQSLFTSEDEDISLGKAIESLKEKRKALDGKKNSVLNDLNIKIDSIVREKYETDRAIENNISIEVQLKSEKEKRANNREELEGLEIYKKHLRQSSLKREYEDIVRYFNKKEEIKSDDDKLNRALEKENIKIDNIFLQEIEDKIKVYRESEKGINEEESHKNNLLNSVKMLEKENEAYEVFISLGGRVKEKIIKLKSDIDIFNEKLESRKNLNNLINEDEEKLKKKEEGILNLKNKRNEINKLLDEEKALSEGYSRGKKKNEFIVVGIILLLVGAFGGLILKNTIVLIGGIVVGLAFVFLYMKSLNENGNTKELERVRERLRKIGYTEEGRKSLDEFTREEEIINLLIEERLNRIEDLNIEEGIERYNQNEKMLESILSMTNSKDIEDLYLKIDDYEKRISKINIIKTDILDIEKRLDRLNFNLKKEKKEILEKSKYIYDNEEIEPLEEKIITYKELIKKSSEISIALENIEETYKTLLKDRDINEIKKELEIAYNDEELSEYMKSDEVDLKIKNLSNLVLENEKRIKVLEGEIKLSLKGFRDINIIEEELFKLKEKRIAVEKKVKAMDIAIEGLKEVELRIKEKFAPKINKSIGKIFEKLTKGRYKNVILKEDYSLEIEGEKWFNSEFLSNGAKDQLYLALRLAFIKVIFKDEEIPVIFDEIFLQYDDKRREEALIFLKEEIKGQRILFTCQNIEENILKNRNIHYNKVSI